MSHPEGCISLQDDAHIKLFETIAMAYGPEHIVQSHALKATGSSAGMYHFL